MAIYDSWGGGGYSGQDGGRLGGLSDLTEVASKDKDSDITVGYDSWDGIKVGPEVETKKPLSYGLDIVNSALTGMKILGPVGAVVGGVVGAGIAAYKSLTAPEQAALVSQGKPVVKDATTGKAYNGADFGIKESGVHTVRSDQSGNIAGYVGSSDVTGATGASKGSTEQQALDYLMSRDQMPRQFSEGALQSLGGIYGLEGGTGSQQDLIERSIASPLYGALMGGQKAGEDAIMRNAAMTGGFRSGNIQDNMYDYNTQLQNRALLESYNQQVQGLEGMANLPSLASPIAGQMNADRTRTDLQNTAQQQMAADKKQSDIDMWMGIGKLGTNLLGMFSDRRLKTNIKLIGYRNGHNLYAWDWNGIANKMGMTGSSIGCMAEEVYEKCKEAVIMKNHFMFVDYSKINVFI